MAKNQVQGRCVKFQCERHVIIYINSTDVQSTYKNIFIGRIRLRRSKATYFRGPVTCIGTKILISVSMVTVYSVVDVETGDI